MTSIDLSAFTMDVEALHIDRSVDFVADIPPNLGSCGMLFDALRKWLQLPSYFGNNWDALDECLRDLWWIDRRRVFILHSDLPNLGPKETLTYLDILSYCVRDWKPGEEHELVVVFPNGALAELMQS